MTMGNSGPTTLAGGNLDEGLNRMVASARTTREYKGKVSMLCEKRMLKRGTGVAWIEPQFEKLYAQDIVQDQEWYNPQQQRINRVLTIVPRAVGVMRLLLKEVSARMSPIGWEKMGVQMQEAMTRKTDVDGLIALARASKTLGTNGAAFDYNRIRAASDVMTGNDDEPVTGQINCVAHRYQITDIDSSLVSNVGDANFGQVSSGLTAMTFRNGFRGKVSDVMVYEDNHIDVSGNAARASVFAKESLVLVNEDIMTRDTEPRPRHGEGADLVILRDKYQYGLRRPDLWTTLIRSDATEPS